MESAVDLVSPGTGGTLLSGGLTRVAKRKNVPHCMELQDPLVDPAVPDLCPNSFFSDLVRTSQYPS